MNDSLTTHGYALRIDKRLFKRIRDSAQRNRRSINREIEYAIDQYLGQEEKGHAADGQ